nr:hypothetical protein [Rhodopirellula sp. SM50]
MVHLCDNERSPSPSSSDASIATFDGRVRSTARDLSALARKPADLPE